MENKKMENIIIDGEVKVFKQTESYIFFKIVESCILEFNTTVISIQNTLCLDTNKYTVSNDIRNYIREYFKSINNKNVKFDNSRIELNFYSEYNYVYDKSPSILTSGDKILSELKKLDNNKYTVNGKCSVSLMVSLNTVTNSTNG